MNSENVTYTVIYMDTPWYGLKASLYNDSGERLAEFYDEATANHVRNLLNKYQGLEEV